MSREIKFRVWDNQYQKWASEQDVEATADLGLTFGTDSYFMYTDGEKRLRWSFCQYTGLKDKNGKEIYEGDIVSAWSEGYNHKGEIRWRFEGQPAIIIYPAFANQGFWKLHGDRGTGDSFTDNKIDNGVEVIGNIYENPDLLQ